MQNFQIYFKIKLFIIFLLIFSPSYGEVIRLSDEYQKDVYPGANLIISGEQWKIIGNYSDKTVFEYDAEVNLYFYKLIKIEISSEKPASIRWGWKSVHKKGADFFSEDTLSLITDNRFHQYTFEMKYPDKVNPIIDKASKLFIEIQNAEKSISSLKLKNVELVRHLPSEVGKFMIKGLCVSCIPENVWTFNTKVQNGDRLQFYMGVYNLTAGALSQKQKDDIWSKEGWKFVVDVLLDGGKENIYQYLMKPSEKEQDRKWQFIDLDLSKFAEKEVRLIFTVENTTEALNEYSIWGNPVIIRQSDDISNINPPIFVISCDTMRADHLLPYGYGLPTSPILDRFTKDSVLFERAYTTRTFTPVAHMSLLTGLFPKNHGVNAELPAFDHVKLLGEYLRDLDYYSLGLVGATTWFLPSRGYTRGMDEFYYPPEYLRDVFATHEILENRIRQLKYNNLFVFLHNYDVHTKMFPPATIYSSDDSRFFYFSDMLDIPELLKAECLPNPRSFFNHIQATLGRLGFFENLYINALYDDCVAKVDYALEELFNFLKEQGLYDKSIIIITADHGEALGEHGRYEHVDVYEHTARIPLIIKFPNNMHAGKRVSSLVSLEDIVPTILHYLKIDNNNLDGISLLGEIERNSGNPRKIFVQNQYQNEEALISDRYKLIYSFRESKVSFFDLLKDPMETENLINKEESLAKQFSSELSSHRFFNGEGWIITIKGKNIFTPDEILICPQDNLISVIPENIMFWYKKADAMDCLYGTISYPKIENTYSLYIYPKDINQELRIGFRSQGKFKVLTLDGSSESISEYEFILPDKPVVVENLSDIPDDGNTYIIVRKKSLPNQERKEVQLPEDAIQDIKNAGYL